MAKKTVIDEITMNRAITRITYEIIENNKNLDDLAILGIKTRGVGIGQRIKTRIDQLENMDVPFGELDTRPFRDDKRATEDTSEIDFDLTGKTVVLVDDVLYTGRTIRAAIDGVIAKGRPARISLAVLVDRGHRELPIRADFVGKNLPTSKSETVIVKLKEYDDMDVVEIKSED
jgi:pyrimidine operon attenuation protein/uracil phosphoribosyltransferase